MLLYKLELTLGTKCHITIPSRKKASMTTVAGSSTQQMRVFLSALGRVMLCLLLAMAIVCSGMAFEEAEAKTKNKYKKKKSAKRAPPYVPPYAELVIDVDSGRVLSAVNATELRHPASLTKMMTLYLLFEAIQADRIKIDQQLYVSEKAASQPQTNISLKTGDTISVRDAIKALVVRSANDVAVVVAESLGQTEWNFATMMTAKAHELGMKNTVFYNASGLPHDQQFSTARDLAILSIALQKHFPDYYSYFSTREFSYNGKTYSTHNRVMLRYDGADGIKTGYVRASGFNLCTSYNKDDRHLVAVVLGGRSSASRDSRMIDMLDEGIAQLAGVTPQEVKMARLTKDSTAQIKTALLPDEDETLATAAGDLPGGEVVTGVAGSTTKPATVVIDEPTDSRGRFSARKRNEIGVSNSSPLASTLKDGGWGVQVGAYEQSREAYIAAANAQSLAPELQSTRIAVTEQNAEKAVHRARLEGLTREQAQNACKKLISQQESCFVYRAEGAM